MKKIAFSLLLFTMTGCMVGPKFQAPETACKESWMVEENVEISDESIRDWWTLFNDPILNNLIHLAYQQNLSLQIACYRIQEARARLGIAIGEFFPQVQEGFGHADRIKLSRNQANTPSIVDYKDYALGLQAAWELDFWGRFRRGIRAEESELISSYSDYDNALVLLFSDVASVYVRIRTLEEQIRIVRENIQIERRGLEISEAQFEGGFVSELDKQQATTLLKDTESRIPNLEKQRQQALNALCVLLGMAPQDISCLISGEGRIPTTKQTITVNIPESILYRRPDITSAFYRSAAQSERIGIAYADFFPQISLTGVIAVQSKGVLFSRDSLTYDYGSQFAWPILNYGRTTNNVRLQEAKFKQLTTEYKNKVLQAYQEVEDGLIAYSKSQEQAELLAASANAARRATELAKTQYVEGMTDFTTVINTQEALLASQESLTLARGNIALSLIATYKALGGGWDLSGYSFTEGECKETCEQFIETPIDF